MTFSRYMLYYWYQTTKPEGEREMAKYVSFDFCDGDYNHYPILVRVEQDISFDVMREMDDAINAKINEYVGNGEYWESDDILVNDIMKEMSKKHNFNYEIITVDYNVDCK